MGLGWAVGNAHWACLISGNMKSYLKQLAHHRLNVLTNIALPKDKKFDKRYNSPLNLNYFQPPTAMVRVVQSQMAKGTSRHLAMVCANKVLPLPVEPNIMMFDFSS